METKLSKHLEKIIRTSVIKNFENWELQFFDCQSEVQWDVIKWLETNNSKYSIQEIVDEVDQIGDEETQIRLNHLLSSIQEDKLKFCVKNYFVEESVKATVSAS